MADHVVLYLMRHKIQKRRYDDMVKAARNRNFKLFDNFSPEVTHVVTEFDTYEQAQRHLNNSPIGSEYRPEFLNISWFTESIKARKPVEITERHRLPREQSTQTVEELESETRFPEWACQRSAPLKHHNEFLTSPLEILEEYAEMKDGDSDYSRALAFRRASCVLKSLPFRVSSIRQLRDVKDIGAHCTRVINEILEDGLCTEVQDIVTSDWFKKMQLFTQVFGIGPTTAKKWIERGWMSIKEAQESPDISKDWRVQWGLAFHDDLMNPVKSNEALQFTQMIKTEAEKILPGIIVQLTGGFRRGKHQGHDIDILFSHPDEDKEVGFLSKLLNRLEKLGMILCGSLEASTFHEKILREDYKLSARGQLDHFEKWLGICKLPKDSDYTPMKLVMDSQEICESSKDADSIEDYQSKAKKQRQCQGEKSPFTIANSKRDWIARRVDFILSPYSQYFYALVGWTGSKHFNRDLRLYAQKVLNRKLTSHGLHDFKSNMNIPATSEMEVFDNLNIQYQEPENRNC